MLDRYRLMPHTLLPYLDADDGAGAGGAGGDAGEAGEAGAAGGEGEAGAAGRTFSQDEVNKLVAREKKRAAEAARKELEDEAKKAAMSEAEKLKVELADKDAAIAAATERANRRAIAAAAQVQALAAGIRPDRVAAAIRLADLAGVACDDDGEPDGAAITASIQAILKAYPEWAASAGGEGKGVGSGANPAGGGTSGEKNPWLKEHWNLTEQGRITRDSPEKARQLRAAAGR